MANISSAFGTIDIFADCDETIRELLKCFEITHWYEYYTSLSDDIDEIKIVDTVGDQNTLKRCCCVDFTGCGRWVYSNNVETLFQNIKENYTTSRDWVDKYEIAEPDWKLLENSDFEVCFEYTDEEPGSELLYKETDTVRHHKGETLEDVECIREDYENYDFTWDNQMELCGYNLWEVLEDSLGYVGEPNEVYEIVSRRAGDIERYLGKPLKEILGEELYGLYLEGEKQAEENGGVHND